MGISKRAEDALINASPAQGAPVSAAGLDSRDLCAAGLVTESGNLTRKGLTERERVLSKRLDEAFG